MAHAPSWLTFGFVYLTAAVLAVPVVRALGMSAIIGYQAAGMSGAWNAAGTGLLFGAMGLPMAGLLIALKAWGGYANRWGEYNYKKELEGEPKKRDNDPDKW